MSKKPRLTDVPSLGAKMEDKLVEAGIKTVLKLSRAKADKLAAKVDGLSEKGAQKLIDGAQKLIPSEPKEPKKEAKTPERKPKKKEPKAAKEVKPKKTPAKEKPKAVEKKPKEAPKKVEKPAKKKPEVKEKKAPPKKAEKPKAKPKAKAPVKAVEAAPKPKKKPAKKKPRAAKKVEPKPELLTKQQVIESRIFRIAAAKRRKQPSFRHEQAHRWIRVSDSWRKVRGIDSKTREKRKGRIAMPTTGYRKPKAVRCIHPSGFTEVLVYRPSELDELNPDMHAVRIGSTVGLRKRQEILKKAETLMLRVLNPGAPETVMEEELFSELDMIEDVEVE